MKWVLIRHGQTQGNLEKRYIGCRTDEPLCEAGRLALREKKYPAVSRVFVSPMRRCVETAQAVYFLCSGAASFITGQVLGVSGGLVI